MLKQRGLCELSEIAEIISIVIKRKGLQVVYLFDCKKSQGPWTNFQGTQIQRNERCHTDKGQRFPLHGGCFRK